MENSVLCTNTTKSRINSYNLVYNNMAHAVTASVDEQLVLSPNFKRNLFIALALGVVIFALGIILAIFGVGVEHSHEAAHEVAPIHAEAAHTTGVEHVEESGHSEMLAHSESHTEGSTAVAAHHGPNWLTRVYAVLWHNSVFFTGIAVMGLFFVCVQYLAWAGWSSIIKRIPEAFGAFIPYGGAALLVIFLLGQHDIFHWTHSELYDINSPEYDKIIVGKSGYLNLPFFLARMVIFVGLWYFCWLRIRKYSLTEDLEGTDTWYNKSGYMAAIFVIIFAVSSSMVAWDWIMSIDTHWFSTMFGWYVFASWWVTALATITLVCILLKENGYLNAMNDNHFHDLGKFVFAFSIFWTYVYFCQFMLIFYANLPEETVYFIERMRGYNGKYAWVIYFNLFVNFAFPFLALMTRESKRKFGMLKIAVIVVILGHWFDFYQMIMPGVTKGTSGFGLIELGGILIFGSAFILVISNAMTKAKLIPANHPMLDEALHHNI